MSSVIMTQTPGTGSNTCLVHKGCVRWVGVSGQGVAWGVPLLCHEHHYVLMEELIREDENDTAMVHG